MPTVMQRLLAHRAVPSLILSVVVVILEVLVGAVDDRR